VFNAIKRFFGNSEFDCDDVVNHSSAYSTTTSNLTCGRHSKLTWVNADRARHSWELCLPPSALWASCPASVLHPPWSNRWSTAFARRT